MKMLTLRTLTLVVVAGLALTQTSNARAAAQVGEIAPDFTLTDLNGRTQRLADYKGKTVVLEWVNPECPFVVKHYESGNIPATQKAATADGVIWIAINSGRPDSQGDYAPTKAKAWLAEQGAAPTAYCRDLKGQVGRLYGAKTTPHLFVINPEGELVYNGAIDSIRSANKADLAKAENYVRTALAELKAGKPIAKPNTQPYGCSVKY